MTIKENYVSERVSRLLQGLREKGLINELIEANTIFLKISGGVDQLCPLRHEDFTDMLHGNPKRIEEREELLAQGYDIHIKPYEKLLDSSSETT